LSSQVRREWLLSLKARRVAKPYFVDEALRGGGVALRPLVQADYVWFYYLTWETELANPWRARGLSPSVEQFQQSLWVGVLCHLVVTSGGSGDDRLGVVTVYRYDTRSGTAFVSYVLQPFARQHRTSFVAPLLVADYLFRCLDFRKLYVEIIEGNERPYKSLLRLFSFEGKLLQYERIGQEFRDLSYFSLDQTAWQALPFINRAGSDNGGLVSGPLSPEGAQHVTLSIREEYPNDGETGGVRGVRE